MATTSYAPPATLDRAQRTGLIAAIIGLALTAASYVIVSPEQFFHSYLLGFFVFFGLCMGSLGLLLLQYLSGGVWGMIARRIFEAGTRVLPVAALLFVPIIFGMHQIYSWMDPAKVAANPIIKDKVDYLNQSFWLVRAAIFFTYWVVISLVINKYAANLDKEPGFKWARKIENFSGVALLFYFITITLAIVDWLMSLTPEWYSTIFGFIIIVGQAVLTMAFTIIVLVKLSRDEPMASIIKPKHLHDFGKLLFAFNFLWAYMMFSQWIITYSGNLPEEIIWYHHRIRGGWQYVAYLVVFVHFFIPFAILLSQDLKKNGRRLIVMAAWLFIMRIVDLYWLIEPNWHREEFFFSWVDVVAPIGFVGLYAYLFVGQYKKRQVLPVGEPDLDLLLHPKGAH